MPQSTWAEQNRPRPISTWAEQNKPIPTTPSSLPPTIRNAGGWGAGAGRGNIGFLPKLALKLGPEFLKGLWKSTPISQIGYEPDEAESEAFERSLKEAWGSPRKAASSFAGMVEPTGMAQMAIDLPIETYEAYRSGDYPTAVANTVLGVGVPAALHGLTRGVPPELLPKPKAVEVVPPVSDPFVELPVREPKHWDWNAPPVRPLPEQFIVPQSQGIQRISPTGEVTPSRPPVAADIEVIKTRERNPATGRLRTVKTERPVATSPETAEAIRQKKISGETVSEDWLSQDPLLSTVPNRLRPEPPNVTALRNLSEGTPKRGAVAPRSRLQFMDEAEYLAGLKREEPPATTLPPVEPVTPTTQPVTPTQPKRSITDRITNRVRNSALYKAIYEPTGVSSETRLARLGDAGKKLAKMLRDERTESSLFGGEQTVHTRRAIRSLKPEEQLELVRILDDKIPLSNASSPKIVEAYKALRGTTETLGDEAIAAGLKLKTASGKTIPFQKHKGEYFPRYFEEGVIKNQEKLTQEFIKAGKTPEAAAKAAKVIVEKSTEELVNRLIKGGKSPAEAAIIAKNVFEKGERFEPSQHTRDVDLPGYREDLAALEKYQYEMAQRITRAKRFGPGDTGDVNSPISKLIAETSNPKEALELVNDILNRNEASTGKPFQQKVANKVTKFMVNTKLSQFAIQNMGDFFSYPHSFGIKRSLAALKDTIMNPHGAADIATQVGSHKILRGELFKDVESGRMVPNGAKTTEKFIRTVGSLAGRSTVQSLFEKAKKNPARYAQELARFVDGDVTTVLKQDKLTPRQIDFAGGRGVELTSGVPDKLALSKAFFPDNPILRLPSLFKRFAFNNSRNILETWKAQPTLQGKIAKVTTMLLAYQAGGEIVGDIKGVIKGLISGDIEKALAGRGDYIGTGNAALDRIMANYLQSALFGLVGDAAEIISNRSTRSKVAGAVGGPVISDIDELINSIGSAIGGDYAPISRSVARRIPYIGSGLAERFRKQEESNKLPSLPTNR
jgi:hypothetical protein